MLKHSHKLSKVLFLVCLQQLLSAERFSEFIITKHTFVFIALTIYEDNDDREKRDPLMTEMIDTYTLFCYRQYDINIQEMYYVEKIPNSCTIHPFL